MDRTMNIIAVALYNLAVLSGTIYVIINYNWSAWWLLLALFACMGCEKVKCKTKDDELADRIKKLYETHDVTLTENGTGRFRVEVKKKDEKRIIL